MTPPASAAPVRKRILMTASTAPRWPGDVEPEFILQLAASLAEEHEVTILAPHCKGAASEEQLNGVHMVRYRYAPEAWESLAYRGGMLHKLKSRPLRWLLVPGYLLCQCLAIWSLHRRHQFDLLHAHWIVPQGLVAALLQMLGIFRGPVILTSHGGDLYSLNTPLFSAIKRAVLKHMDGVNVVSSSMLAPCRALGVDDARIFVRSMGVDLQHRFIATSDLQQRRGLLFVGRLVEKKGVDTLLDAWGSVRHKYPDLTLTIVGDGPLLDSLKAVAEAERYQRSVIFTGAIPNRQVPEQLNRAQIALVPSVVAADGDQEGLGLVAVEAMGCGCAVICSQLPALDDVIKHGRTGLMVPPGDSVALAHAMVQLLDDPVLLRSVAEAGRQSVRARFDWQAVAADYAGLYRQVIDNR